MTIRKLDATAWMVYGVGSSGYVLMIPVIGYATYFHTQVAGGGPEAATYWSLAVAGALHRDRAGRAAAGSFRGRQGKAKADPCAADRACLCLDGGLDARPSR